MPLRHFTVLACLFWALPVHATVDCRLVTSLSRLANITHASQSAWQNGRPDADLLSEIWQYDRSSLIYAFRADAESEQLVLIGQFADILMQIAADAGRQDARAITRTLNLPVTTRVFTKVGRLLQQLPCDGASATASQTEGSGKSSGTSEDAAKGAASPQSAKSISISSSWIIIAAATALILAILGTVFLYFRQREKSRRRARRFSLNQIVKFASGDARAFGRILDISCVGVKLRHYGQLSSAITPKVDIELSGEWYEATISWSNDHYVGLAFGRPLRFATVLLILSGVNARNEQDVRDAKSKTAPIGAPSQGHV